MAALSLPTELPAGTAEGAADPHGEGRPMLGLTLGLLISVPLWVGLWCASAWI